MNEDDLDELLGDDEHPIAWFALSMLGALDIVFLLMLAIPALLFLHTKSVPQ